MLKLLIGLYAGGWAMVWSDGRPWTPQVNGGREYKIVNAAGEQVGSIVQPAGARVDVMGVILWVLGQFDVNADGFFNADDYDAWMALFVAGSPMADFDANGFVNGEDADAFEQGFRAGLPEAP